MSQGASPSPRADILALLQGQRPARLPCFSGLISVTEAGLSRLGWRLSEVHHEAGKLAAAAATTHQLTGFESAVLPLDLCVEAEALGATVDFREDAPHPAFPRVTQPVAASSVGFDLRVPPDLTQRGRLPIVADAIRRLKEQAGQELVIGAWVPGPFTLGLYLVDMVNLMIEVAKEPEAVGKLLEALTDALIEAAKLYHSAGADFVTVHEMGGSPGFIGPPSFKRLILPRLQRLLATIPGPSVLSVCGNTNRAMPLLAEAGANAISVDQLNDLARSRQTLGPKAILFGNLDPVETLANGDEAAVRDAVRKAIEAGADAVWPGCDLWPLVPVTNLRAMVDEAQQARTRLASPPDPLS
jgi:[methyl-Co(III) methanol-specific corrinoid protein]:coenzyme M methyltransferase